ncbi:MAG: hypothetical protein ABR499_00625 [Gemmatimonadaceae bacterium]
MRSGRDLMDLHLAALFTHDADGHLVRVNKPNGGPARRFFVGRTRGGVGACPRLRAHAPVPGG